MEGFLRYQFGGLIFGGAYTWRGLFSEFYGIWFRFGFQNKHRGHVKNILSVFYKTKYFHFRQRLQRLGGLFVAPY